MKPSFFQNEQLAELPFEARLLFVGLWCLADREGRLEDRPKRIKMHVFPADMLDVEPLLHALAERDLIKRYAVEGKQCIWIPSFLKHQRPHQNENPSELPKFHEEPKLCTKVESTCDLGAKHFALNPSSLNPSSLNPESPLPPKGGCDRFPDFWQAYPKKIGKAAAKRCWSRKGLDAQADAILAHLATRVRSDAQWLDEDGRYIPNPATWINRDGWEDVYAMAPPKRHYL